jgi:hypothetical protein|tara:strand:+ start:401 stop:577 length:177 start_codon:yes stop_codon:yes gene_type:complete
MEGEREIQKEGERDTERERKRKLVIFTKIQNVITKSRDISEIQNRHPLTASRALVTSA